MPQSIAQVRTARPYARINMDSSGRASNPSSPGARPDDTTTPVTVSVDVGDGYRMAVPGPLLPLPLDNIPIEPTSKLALNQEMLRQEIRGQLSAHDVEWYSLNIVYRRLPGDDASKNRATAVIVAKRSGDGRQWINFLGTVYGMLESLGYPEFYVEIVDPIARFGKSTMPILVSDPLVSAWPVLREKVLAILGDQTWNSLQVLLRGYAGDSVEMKPTIFLLVQDRNAPLWRGIKDQIREVCQSLDVEIVQGRSIWQTGKKLFAADFVPIVNGGSSMGPPKGSGTLGGYLNLTQPRQSLQTFGITNYHVVKTDQLTDVHDQNGVSNAAKLNCEVEVFSPSENDTAASIEDIDFDLGLSQSSWENLERKVHLGSPSTKEQANYDAMKLARDESTGEKDIIQGLDRRFGKLHAASGFRKNTAGFALDWAMISPPVNRIGQNLLPRRRDFPGSPKIRILQGHSIASDWSEDCYKANGELVFKKGRSTGLTWGYVNGIKADIHFPEEPKGTVWTAYDIVPPLGGDAHHYSSRGDSGSFVFDADGKLAGLLFAGSEPDFGQGTDLSHGYVIPIGAVIDDIEAMTGGKVSLP